MTNRLLPRIYITTKTTKNSEEVRQELSLQLLLYDIGYRVFLPLLTDEKDFLYIYVYNHIYTHSIGINLFAFGTEDMNYVV